MSDERLQCPTTVGNVIDMTTTPIPAHKTKAGFPLQHCGRCGGSGSYSWNAMTGSACFGCGGSGWVIAAGARKAKAEYDTALRREVEPSVTAIEPGDRIEFPYRSGEWHTVEAVIVDHDEERGWSGTERTPVAWRAFIVWADCTFAEVGTNNVLRRKVRDSWAEQRAAFVADALKGWRRSGKKGGIAVTTINTNEGATS